MYKKLLIATDGSALAHKAVEQGVALAKEIGASVIAITVQEPFSSPAIGNDTFSTMQFMQDFEKESHANAEKLLHKVRQEAALHGVACDTVYVHDKTPYQGIIDTAKKEHCDLIVMSSHGRRGIAGLLLGSQAVHVLTHSHIPVLICK